MSMIVSIIEEIASIRAQHDEHMQALKALEAAFSNPAITLKTQAFLTHTITLSSGNAHLGFNR